MIGEEWSGSETSGSTPPPGFLIRSDALGGGYEVRTAIEERTLIASLFCEPSERRGVAGCQEFRASLSLF